MNNSFGKPSRMGDTIKLYFYEGEKLMEYIVDKLSRSVLRRSAIQNPKRKLFVVKV